MTSTRPRKRKMSSQSFQNNESVAQSLSDNFFIRLNAARSQCILLDCRTELAGRILVFVISWRFSPKLASETWVGNHVATIVKQEFESFDSNAFYLIPLQNENTA
ncbi:uncharacterized protein PHALS_10761 [Plasmopara halstedii]|uniref:Uncharacterized protein n=1 Tax=Plasmopara halstedii TaxID=4781 RepID=A0A0P1AI56_PLAHL|nr:uncharacterized protein PHALS_10761 [Plasmopara halstedii]CEG40572.1 hypothetical protein PHALS_10761 [Plasmopara halstedii]|eukprot:XP_024576941.1 hypothetical protein PHALS_10761 [Plasmopara halstedii]